MSLIDLLICSNTANTLHEIIELQEKISIDQM